MYFFVPYNISDIQKGIQAGHCSIQYVIEHGHSQEFHDFFVNDKTWIILNGGATRFSRAGDDLEQGSLNQILDDLDANNIPCSHFCEPDLNNALTAICFLADERVWDFENYPDLESDNPDSYVFWTESIGGENNIFLRSLIRDKRLA
jgi:hypothetical protein